MNKIKRWRKGELLDCIDYSAEKRQMSVSEYKKWCESNDKMHLKATEIIGVDIISYLTPKEASRLATSSRQTRKDHETAICSKAFREADENYEDLYEILKGCPQNCE